MKPWLKALAIAPFVAVIKVYQFTLSPIFGRGCRFVPTCSYYGLEAYRLHGPFRGTVLTAKRILRCHPFVKGGYDPVPLPQSALRPTPSAIAAEGTGTQSTSQADSDSTPAAGDHRD